MRRSWALYLQFGEKGLRESFDDGPLAFYQRARALGLYQA